MAETYQEHRARCGECQMDPIPPYRHCAPGAELHALAEVAAGREPPCHGESTHHCGCDCYEARRKAEHALEVARAALLVGTVLRIVRQKSGHTLGSLARHLGISTVTLSDIERGKVEQIKWMVEQADAERKELPTAAMFDEGGKLADDMCEFGDALLRRGD